MATVRYGCSLVILGHLLASCGGSKPTPITEGEFKKGPDGKGEKHVRVSDTTPCGENPTKEVDSEKEKEFEIATEAAFEFVKTKAGFSADAKKAFVEKIDESHNTSTLAKDIALLSWVACRQCVSLLSFDEDKCSELRQPLIDAYKDLSKKKGSSTKQEGSGNSTQLNIQGDGNHVHIGKGSPVAQPDEEAEVMQGPSRDAKRDRNLVKNASSVLNSDD